MKRYFINTSADKLYFSRLLNLIGSVRLNCNKSIDVEVWDLGLTKFQIFILKLLNIKIHKVDKFSEHWNLCYSWKLYVYKKSDCKLFLHLDAGNIVLKDLDLIFSRIENEDFFLIDQGQNLNDIIPSSFYRDFGLINCNKNELVFAAGNIGFNKANEKILKVIDEAYEASIDGYCLGYSKSEIHRDDHNLKIIRDCKLFRHDQSVINILMRKYFKQLNLNPHKIYSSLVANDDVYIYNQRGYNYKYIKYLGNSYCSILLIIYSKIIDLFNRIARKCSIKRYKSL